MNTTDIDEHQTDLQTLQFYENYASKVAQRALGENVDSAHEKFTARLPDNARILEAGCGPGRDVKYFLKQGYSVDAFDGSSSMCDIAREYTGHNIKNMKLTEINEEQLYDGVWASASILHLRFSEVIDVFKLIEKAVKPGGVFYSSFKFGDGERISQKSGRRFTNMNFDSMRSLCDRLDNFKIVEMWLTEDNREYRKQDMWLNTILEKGRSNDQF
ncbi:MAG: class I SAM-dependent methyltransferase [Sedimenticola sp.]